MPALPAVPLPARGLSARQKLPAGRLHVLAGPPLRLRAGLEELKMFTVAALFLVVVYGHSKVADTWTPVVRLVSVPGS